MADETPQTEVKERSIAKRVVLITMAVLVALIGLGFLASRTGLDKALLRQQLDAFATNLQAQGKRDGRDVVLTYKDVAIRGGFSNRHAVILEPQLSVKPLVQEGEVKATDNLVIRTAELRVFPKSSNLKELQVAAPAPIDFYDASDLSRKLLTVATDAPFTTDVRLYSRDNVSYAEVTQHVPEKIDFTYLREQKAEGPEEATPTVVPVYETLVMTQAPGGLLYSDVAQDGSDLGTARIQMQDIVLTPQVQPDAAVRIAQVSSDWKHSMNEKKHHAVEASAQVGEITADAALLPYAPINFSVKVGYEGAAPQTAQDLSSIRAQESSFKLYGFTLSTKEASLNATADFVASPTDVLPVGMASITLTNVPYVMGELRRFGVLNPATEPLATEILQLATGTPMAEMKDAQIDINRARGGSFAIGKTTFEELFATVLQHGLRQQPSVVPLPSPEKKPAAEPKKIQVEEGARG